MRESRVLTSAIASAARNPTLDLGEVRQLCQTYQLGGLEELIEEAGLLG